MRPRRVIPPSEPGRSGLRLLATLALTACGPAAETGPPPVETAPRESAPPDSDLSPEIPDPPLPDAGPVPEERAVGHVVWVVIDGARADETIFDGWSSAADRPTAEIAPVLREQLFPQGTLLRPAYATGSTYTSEAHAEMILGWRYPLTNTPGEEGPGYFRPEAPTIFESISSAEGVSPDEMWFVANVAYMEGHTWSLTPGLGETYGGRYLYVTEDMERPGGDHAQPANQDTTVLKYVQDQLARVDTRFLMANLHRIDRQGHYGTGADYAEAITRVDQPILDLWNWLQATPPYAGDTIFVVTADHGRHRWGTEEDFHNHGDNCAGCRQIPTFLAGPGVEAGVVVTDETFTMEDLTRTVAHLAGVEMPYATGMVIQPALTDPPDGPGRSGTHRLEVAGGLTASEVFADDPTNQTRVMVDGEVLSDPAAIHAEAPRVAVNDTHALVCWRQLILGFGDYVVENWPWHGECRVRSLSPPDGAWRDIRFPTREVWSWHEPDLAPGPNGSFLLAWVDNPWSSSSVKDNVWMRLHLWSPVGGWRGTGQGNSRVSYPIHPTVAWVGDHALVAYTNGLVDPSYEAQKSARYHRHVEVWRVDLQDGDRQAWSLALEAENNDMGHGDPDNPYARLEHPDLLALGPGCLDGGAGACEVHLAMTAYGDACGSTVVTWRSADGGITWTGPIQLDATGRVLGVVPPRWSTEGDLHYVRLDDDGVAQACRVPAGADVATCQDLGTRWVRSLVPVGGGVAFTAYDGGGAWGTGEVAW